MSTGIRTAFRYIQDWIKKMLSNSITQEVLDDSQALPRLKSFLSEDNATMRQVKAVPPNIVEDLTIISRKWGRGDLSVLARRGLRQGAGQTSLDPDWPHLRKDNFFGHGHLVPGQAWRFRMEMCRDGAHGPPMAGIAGTEKQGARSIVMGLHDEKHNQFYADVDMNETIYYVGTALPRKKDDDEPTNVKDSTGHRPSRTTRNSGGNGPTHHTKALMTSCKTGREVRVFRSFRESKICPLRPAEGYRYDGLYRVVSFKLLNRERQIYRFKLTRLTTGQGPLRLSLAPPRPEKRKRQS
jgi:hypothetical protein